MVEVRKPVAPTQRRHQSDGRIGARARVASTRSDIGLRVARRTSAELRSKLPSAPAGDRAERGGARAIAGELPRANNVIEELAIGVRTARHLPTDARGAGCPRPVGIGVGVGVAVGVGVGVWVGVGVGAVPNAIPDTCTFCGLAAASSAISNTPVSLVVFEVVAGGGLNLTETEQVTPGARIPRQPSAANPSAVMPVMKSATGFLLLNATNRGALRVPRCVLGNESVCGLNCSAPRTPEPLRPTGLALFTAGIGHGERAAAHAQLRGRKSDFDGALLARRQGRAGTIVES